MIRLIAGSGRSGTTWIQDALATANGLRPVFEPLHPYVSAIGNRYGHRAISADEEHPELEAFWRNVCAGRGPRLWTVYRQQWRWLFPPPAKFATRTDAGRFRRHWAKFLAEMPRMTSESLRRQPLVKCIRANLMLPWIANHLDCRIVLIVRHPGAVLESQLRAGWNASFALDRFRNDVRLRELTHGRYDRLLSRKLTPVQALAVRWIVENQWVIEEAVSAGIVVIHYEELRSSDRGAWNRLCAALNLSVAPDPSVLARPSQQSGAKRSLVPIKQSSSPRWMAALTPENVLQIQSILDEVQFDAYRLNESLPRRLTDCAKPSRLQANDL